MSFSGAKGTLDFRLAVIAWKSGMPAPLLFFLFAFLVAGPAHADTLAGETIALAAWVVIVVGALFLPIVLWQRRQLRVTAEDSHRLETDSERLAEILAAAPDGYYRWDITEDGRIVSEQCSRRLAVLLDLFSGVDATFIDVRACFETQAIAKLDAALERLRYHGEGFEIELPLKERRRRVLVWGVRAVTADGRALADMVWMRDVTEGIAAVHRLSEEVGELAAERDLLRTVFDALPIPVWVRGADLGLLACNAAYAHAVEAASPEEALDAGRELVPAAQVREARALAARARAAGTKRSEAFHLVMAGDRKLAELIETPIATDGSDGLHTVGLAFDQTAQEEAQAMLERHVAAHGEVLEKLGTAIAIFSADTRLAFFNTAFCQLWGLDSEQLRAKPSYGALLDVLRERRRLPEVADFRAFKDEETRRFTSLIEARVDLMHLPDERTLRRVVSPHPFGGLLFTFEDVTDALALERLHNTSLAVHRETLDNLHEGIAVFASDGRLRLSNPSYALIWGVPAELLARQPHFAEMVEHHRSFFEDDAGWEGIRAQLMGLFTEREARHGRIERTDGPILDYASVPLPDGAVLTTWLDVSDTARVEMALLDRNDALAAADRLKSEFIANVSAEVRTPLSTMIGHADILCGDLFGSLNDRQKEYALAIGQSARHLDQVFSDILDLAAIEAGQLKLSLNAIDVHATLTKVLTLTRERMRERHIALSFDCPLDIGWMVADERRVRQALFNLVSNAVKVTPEQGQVTVTARRGQGRQGEEIVLAVEDGGPGLSEAERERLISPRPPSGSVGDGGQAGMSLMLVKNFVALHGGHVEIEGGAHDGTTFRLHFPAGEL